MFYLILMLYFKHNGMSSTKSLELVWIRIVLCKYNGSRKRFIELWEDADDL
jgi:hypothetical protein